MKSFPTLREEREEEFLCFGNLRTHVAYRDRYVVQGERQEHQARDELNRGVALPHEERYCVRQRKCRISCLNIRRKERAGWPYEQGEKGASHRIRKPEEGNQPLDERLSVGLRNSAQELELPVRKPEVLVI